MRIAILLITAAVLGAPVGVAVADEAPIVGKIKAVDAAAQTLMVTSTAKGKTRDVVIDVKPGTKIVRFVKGADASKAAVSEQSVALGDLKPGWMVSVVTRHDGPREVAETVRVVHEP